MELRTKESKRLQQLRALREHSEVMSSSLVSGSKTKSEEDYERDNEMKALEVDYMLLSCIYMSSHRYITFRNKSDVVVIRSPRSKDN